MKRAFSVFAVIAFAATAARLPNTGRVGNLFTLHYPDNWTFQASGNSGVLTADVGLSKRGQEGIAIPVNYSKTLYSVSDEREVLRAVAGQLPPILERKLSHSRRPIGRDGGWAHTWELKALFSNESIGIVKIYAIPLAGNGSVLMSAWFTMDEMRRWERDLDAIAETITSKPEPTPATTSEAKKPVVTNPAKLETEPEPLPTPAPDLTPAQRAALIAEWKTRLAGKVWQAAKRTYKLDADGKLEYAWQSTIAGLGDDQTRKRSITGDWRIIVKDAQPFLFLNLPDMPMTLPCTLEAASVVIDGDVVTAN